MSHQVIGKTSVLSSGGLVHMLAGIFAWLAIWIISVLAFSRSAPVEAILEPPQELRPGYALPGSIPCELGYAQKFSCRVTLGSEVIYFTIAGGSRLILQTSITTHDHSLGRLVAAWGSPERYAQVGRAMYTFWSTRWAFAPGCMLEKDSSIQFIGYGEADSGQGPMQMAPWHGFVGSSRDCPQPPRR